MLAETIAYRNVYIICGYTDMRKSINGLVAILTQQYQIKPDAESLYLFCGKRADRMKAILWEEDGFLLLYKVLTGYKYQWPRNASEVRLLTRMQYTRLKGAVIPTSIMLSIAFFTLSMPMKLSWVSLVPWRK